jgi:hypothetical protein
VAAESSVAGGVAPPPREAEGEGVVVAGVAGVSTGSSPRKRTVPGDGALAAELRAPDEERDDTPAPAKHWEGGGCCRRARSSADGYGSNLGRFLAVRLIMRCTQWREAFYG